VHQELKSNRSVTLQLLWEEYKESQRDGPATPALQVRTVEEGSETAVNKNHPGLDRITLQ
jgi:hypothetical protein